MKASIKPGIVLPEGVLSYPFDFEDYFWYKKEHNFILKSEELKKECNMLSEVAFNIMHHKLYQKSESLPKIVEKTESCHQN